MVASIVLHALILFLLMRHGAEWLSGAGDSTGPRGGGGGGSGPAVRYVELPAAAAPEQQAAAPIPEPPIAIPPPMPVPAKLDVPLPELTLAVRPAEAIEAAPASGAGTGGGPGAGPGTGGGIGGGVGTGVGNDSGPGRGGDGEYISPPYARTVLLPADCAHGRFTVQFWVAADGHVSRVAIDPLPKDAGCRRDMRDKMMGYQFLPARTRDGRAVAGTYQVRLQH
jgi:protein TonB